MTVFNGKPHLSILFVDDRKENFIIKERLERAFEALGCKVRFTYEADIDKAYEMVSEVPRRFDVVLADLLFRDAGDTGGEPVEEAVGPDFIHHIRTTHPSMVIVAITTQMSVRHPDLDRRATSAGADLMLIRGLLRSDSSYGGTNRLALDIYRLAGEHRLIDIRPRLDPTDEPGVESVIEDVGEASLRVLLSELSRVPGLEPVSVSLTYVTPGASGARVLRVDARMPDGGPRTLLVKLGQDRQALVRELANFDRVQGRYTNNLIVRYIGREPVSRGDWVAIATEFTEDARTLREWLLDSESAPHVSFLFERLFLGRGLASAYQSPLDSELGRSPLSALTLPAHRRVRVRAAVDALACILGHQEGAGIADVNALLTAVREFSRDGRIIGIPSSATPADGLVCVNAHGDLHGGNVLVYDDGGPRPLIIDLASYDPHHWAYDLARLVADIILRVLDGPAECHFWRRFAQWREVTRLAGALETDITDEPNNIAAVTALNWIGQHRRNLLPELDKPERRWEWHVALAEQLLRATYQPHLPTPKRALGLVAAYDQLRLARSEIPARDGW